jgi:hypothetical protein
MLIGDEMTFCPVHLESGRYILEANDPFDDNLAVVDDLLLLDGPLYIRRRTVRSAERQVETFVISFPMASAHFAFVDENAEPVDLADRTTVPEAISSDGTLVVFGNAPDDFSIRAERTICLPTSLSDLRDYVRSKGGRIPGLFCSSQLLTRVAKFVRYERFVVPLFAFMDLDNKRSTLLALQAASDIIDPRRRKRLKSARTASAKLVAAALRLCEWDSANRNFITLPFESAWAARVSESDGQRIVRDVRRGQYRAGHAEYFLVPKGRLTFRRGVRLSLQDAFAYAVLAQQIALTAVEYAVHPADYAYRLAVNPTRGRIFMNQAPAWKEYRRASLSLLREHGTTHVLCADIFAFYDNIEHELLIRILREAGVTRALLTVIGRCIDSWAEGRGRGIPQGYSGSDLLAKLLLSWVDRRLQARNLRHVRYVDDYRIFCSSERHAQVALAELTATLSALGLDLQPTKTAILSAARAKEEFLGPQNLFRDLERTAGRGLVFANNPAPYDVPIKHFRFIHGDALPTIRRVYEQTFLEQSANGVVLDSGVLRYLLNRLAALGSKIAVDRCAEYLADRPEDTPVILRYLEKCEDDARIASGFLSRLTPYGFDRNYQTHHLLRFLIENRADESHAALPICREIVMSSQSPIWLRGYAALLLAHHEQVFDVALVRGAILTTENPAEKAIFVAALEGTSPIVLAGASIEFDTAGVVSEQARLGYTVVRS